MNLVETGGIRSIEQFHKFKTCAPSLKESKECSRKSSLKEIN